MIITLFNVANYIYTFTHIFTNSLKMVDLLNVKLSIDPNSSNLSITGE